MAHSLVFGMTESGKTTFAKQMSHALHSEEKTVLLLDPLNDPEWYADFRTTDGAQFLEVCKANESCYLIVDESGQAIGKYDSEMEWLATQSRHWGHSCIFISQRGAQLSTTIRAQCRHLFLFTSAKDDCKILANEFNCPELVNASQLPQGHYFHKPRFGPLQKGKLW